MCAAPLLQLFNHNFAQETGAAGHHNPFILPETGGQNVLLSFVVIDPVQLTGYQGHVRIHHHPHKLFKIDLRFPL